MEVDSIVAADEAILAEVEQVVAISNKEFLYVEYILTKHDNSAFEFGWDGDVWAAGTTRLSVNAGVFHIRIMRSLNDQIWYAMDLISWEGEGHKGSSGNALVSGTLDQRVNTDGKAIKPNWHVVKKVDVPTSKRLRLFTLSLLDGSAGDFWLGGRIK